MSTATMTPIPPYLTEQIDDENTNATLTRLSRCASSNALVAERLRQLRREWELERALETWFASAVLGGLTLSATRDRRWLALPAVAAGFMIQHSLHGWCPPVQLLRRLGFRTAKEIGRERYALKAMRGDFAGLGLDRGPGCAGRAYDAAAPR